MLDSEVMSSFIPNAKLYVSYLTTIVTSATSSCSRGSFRESEEPIRKENMERRIDAQLLISLDGISRIEPAGCYDELAKLTPGYVGAILLALVTRTATTDIKRMLTELKRQH
ncbi:hypothetical protein pipiens_015377 [Culex pipiens pipiens]|uniref:Uncharacterized protein n=1 Tax=Culex pipiens pipiens TaxID=38569 RepID=A0ABD1CQU6_CULPP